MGEKDGYGVSETVTSDITLSKVAVPEVSSANSKAVITGSGTLYYTTNGTAPTTNSTVYTSPFNITNGMIINTMAVQSGSEISETATYYTVVYNLMGGSGTIYPQVIKKNTTAAIRSLIPKKDGYTFKGWSLSSSAKTVDYKQGESLFANKSLSLYAVWEADTYTVTYDFNGGVGDTKSQIKTYGVDLKLSEVSPMKDNYTFKGWSTEKNSDRVDYNTGDWYRANETVTLYAVWEKKTFTVHFDANGGDNAPDEQYKVVEEPLILTDEIPTRPGYRFKGWTVSSGTDNVFFEAGATYTFDSNITLYAVWTPGEYNITFITNDGKINSGNVDTYIYLSGAALPTDVTRDGYVFEGWYDNPEFAGKKIEQIEVSEYGEKTYYAKWSINSSVTVVYNAAYNGGEQENRTVTMATGSDVDLSVPATKDGWTFVGWNTNPNETKALSSYKATGYTTLYAIFSKTITASFYSANNRLQGTKTVTIYNKAEKGTITAPAVYPYNSWDVLGWRNDTFPLPSMYNEGSSIIIEADTDYYAVYSRTLTLSYNPNGGSTTPKSEIFNQICSASGNRESKEFRLSVGPTRDGYTFDKWAKSSLDGETYNEGEPISIDNDTMMYAIWKESSSPSTPTPTPKPDEPVIDPAKKPSVVISSVSANGNNITVSGKINNPGNWNMRGVSCVLNCSVGHYEAVQECAIKTDYSFSETLRWTNDNIGMATVQATISFDYADTSYTIKSNSDECMVGNSKKKYIELSPKALSLSVGEKTVLLVSTNSQILGYDSIVWKSDNENAVSVSNDGEIKALKAGRANVKATVMQKGKTVASTSAEVVVSNNYISNSFDFSEWNMYKSTGTTNRKNGWDVNDGNAMKALAYLTRWNGVINESDDRYNGADGRIDISGKYHVQEAIFISPKESQIENQKISDNAAYIRDMKSMLMTYGGIYSSVYYDNDYFADEEHSYYFCPEKTKNGQNLKNNHAIAIVGWDDNISKSKFTNHGINPRDNGAFICKNSYGDNQNDNGYFYISYDDVFLGANASTVFNNVEAFSSSGYNKIYQYDYLGATAAITLNDNDKSVYCASVFTNNTSESETLKAVSTYAYNESERYNVYIIKNIGASEEDKKNALKNGITTDNLKAGGSLQYKGYYTIDLDEDVTIEPNETFAVVIKLINNQNAYFYMESKGNSNYYSNATANDGESFVSRDGMEWYDCNSEIKGYEGSNVCVKAFSKTNGGDISIMSVVEDDAPFKLFGAIEVSDSGGLESDILVGKSSVDGKMEDYKFPAVYDLRTLGFVTSVKDQAPYSSCWAFATYASLESCLMKKSAMIDKSRILEGASEGEYINLATQEIPVTGISIDELSKSYAQIIPVGYQRNVSASITPFNASDSSVKWHSDDDAVASVDEHGVISGLKVGTTTITAETGDGKYSDSFVVTVREPTTDIYSVELSDENIIVKNNQKFTIDYIVRPLNAVDYDIDIISKNPDVVTVDENGILQAASLGIAEVEITAIGADGEHYSAICTVTVDDEMELNISCNSHSLGVYSNMTFGGIKLDVNNKTDDKVSVSIYIAFYDGNGTLLGVKKYEETFNSGSNVTEYNNLTMEGMTKSVKVFAWDQNLKPCSAAIDLNV